MNHSREVVGDSVGGGRRRLNGGGEVEEEHQGVLPHSLVVLDGREAARDGLATAASGGDGSGSDDWAAPVVFASAEVRRS